jgi:hypothetical protein
VRSRIRRAASAALLCCLASARADAATSEVVVAGLNLQQMPSADGGSIGVSWVRAADTHVITAGTEISNIGPSQWSVVRVTAAQLRGGRPALSGSLDVGPGSNGDDRFTFLKVGLGLSGSVTERWTLFGQSTYVDVEPVSGNIVAIGGETRRSNGLSFRLETSQSVSGTLDERSHIARVDYRKQTPYYMAGIVATTTNSRLSLGAAPTETSATRVRQLFLGMSFPIGRKDLTIALDVGKAGDVRRSGLSFFFRSPLEPHE